MRKLKLDELERLTIEEFKNSDRLNISVVLDNIRSAHNVGSLFRTADALGLEHIYITGISAQPPHPEINKTAIGATLSVPWSYKEDIKELLEELKTTHQIIGVEQTNESIELSKYNKTEKNRLAVVFGNEVNGLSEVIIPLLDQCLEIQQFGTKHSLNVSVCGGIVLHHLSNLYRVKS